MGTLKGTTVLTPLYRAPLIALPQTRNTAGYRSWSLRRRSWLAGASSNHRAVRVPPPPDKSYDVEHRQLTAVSRVIGSLASPILYECGRALSSCGEPVTEPQWVAICCYKNRDITGSRCADCQGKYGCPGFRSSAEILCFNELIPPSMRGAPLPLNLWPQLWKAIEPEAEMNFTGEPTPVGLLIAALGLTRLMSAPVPQKSDA
jgi:hypothetical protein